MFHLFYCQTETLKEIIYARDLFLVYSSVKTTCLVQSENIFLFIYLNLDGKLRYVLFLEQLSYVFRIY